ncbi:hypothetical protein RR48_15119 [Papilio machaon]|uniref:Uncharacterized protein n=1 Tax=Papilio machaon TaxID=76193 RepID=A0A194QTX0_PAPMA|nr:hypothetical protein RR48_15119 [Papilio machaon]
MNNPEENIEKLTNSDNFQILKFEITIHISASNLSEVLKETDPEGREKPEFQTKDAKREYRGHLRRPWASGILEEMQMCCRPLIINSSRSCYNNIWNGLGRPVKHKVHVPFPLFSYKEIMGRGSGFDGVGDALEGKDNRKPGTEDTRTEENKNEIFEDLLSETESEDTERESNRHNEEVDYLRRSKKIIKHIPIHLKDYKLLTETLKEGQNWEKAINSEKESL